MVGLIGAEAKLPGEISGGMRKRAGLARALVLDPEIILFDEPDSGLDPVRTAYLNQLIIDLNDAIDATFLIVTHDMNTARTVPDNIGLLYRRHLAMFGPREMLLSSDEPVVRQFLNAQRQGPIGMAEEKDADELAQEEAEGYEMPPLPPIPLQLLDQRGQGPPDAARAGRLVPGERRDAAARVVRVDRDRRRDVTSRDATRSSRAPERPWAQRPVPRRPAARGPAGQPGPAREGPHDEQPGSRRPAAERQPVRPGRSTSCARCRSARSRPRSSSSRPGSSPASPSCRPRWSPSRSARSSPSSWATSPGSSAPSRSPVRPACSPSCARPARSSPPCSSPAPAARRSAPTSVRARSARRSTRWRCWASPRSSASSCPGCSRSMLVAVLLNGLVSVVGVMRRLLLQRRPAGRHARRLPRQLHRPRPAARPLRRRAQGAGLRGAGGDRRLLQGPDRRWRPEGRRRRGQPVGRHHLHAAVRRQLRDHGDLLPGRPPEGRRDGRVLEVPRASRSMAWTASAGSCASTAARLGLDPAHAAPLQEGGPAAARPR